MNPRAVPNSVDWLLPNVHRIVPDAQMRKVPWAGASVVKVYRAVGPNDPAKDIKPGDWIALSKSYASQHGGISGAVRVLEKRVPATHVSWAGTDMNEWFYTPGQWESIGPFESQVEKMCETSGANIAEPIAKKYGIKMWADVRKIKIELGQIIVPKEKRGEGIGRKAVQDLKVIARRLDLPIFLIPEPDPGKKGALLRFYKQLGFVENKGRHKDFELGSAFAAGMYWRPDWN